MVGYIEFIKKLGNLEFKNVAIYDPSKLTDEEAKYLIKSEEYSPYLFIISKEHFELIRPLFKYFE